MLCIWDPISSRRILTLCLALAALMLLALGPSPAQGQVTRAELREDLFRYTGRYIDQLSEALDALRSKAKTARVRRQAQDSKVAAGENAIRISVGPYPEVNLLDMVVLVSLQRTVLEDHWIPKEFGKKSGAPLARVLRKLEAEIWSIAAKVLSAPQQEELRRLIKEWRKRNPEVIYVEATRFGDFSKEFAKSALAKAGSPGFLLPEVGAAGEAVEELRLLGERLMFYLQYLPPLTRAQADLIALDLLNQPETRTLLANADAITAQVKQFNVTLEALPDEIAARQIEVVDHAVARLKEEQELLLNQLQESDERMRGFLADVRKTAEVGQALAAQIDSTTDKVTVLVEPDETDPFTPTRIAQLLGQADQVAQRTERLVDAAQTLLVSAPAGESSAALITLVDRIDREADDLVDRFFWGMLILLLVILIGAPISMLAYRYASQRLPQPAGKA
ncbi:MAG: hypothetical protein QNJ94_09440 [Alphaproteobacteria bacterium]|nr:hypothetical protein [Alphaproteobacteria bacterium]